MERSPYIESSETLYDRGSKSSLNGNNINQPVTLRDEILQDIHERRMASNSTLNSNSSYWKMPSLTFIIIAIIVLILFLVAWFKPDAFSTKSFFKPSRKRSDIGADTDSDCESDSDSDCDSSDLEAGIAKLYRMQKKNLNL